MHQSRALRTARGSAAASVSTFVALVAHVISGGQMPGPIGIVAPLVLSTTICVLLAGRRLSALRLSISVVVSQLLFHGLFVLGTVSTDAVSGSAGGGSHHAMTTSLSSLTTVASTAGAPMDHSFGASPAMWLGHLVAAVITIAALHRGESILARLGAMTRLVIARALPLRLRVETPVNLRRRPVFAFATEVTLPSLGDHSSPFSLRGPPLVSAQ